MYVKIENNTPAEWPVQAFQIRSAFSHVSFPSPMSDEDVLQFGFEPYKASDKPVIDELVESVEEVSPVKQADGSWLQQWQVVEKYSPEERERLLAEREVEREKQRVEQVRQSIMDGVQRYLDDFAQTKTYDGILSACTYATSSVPKFAAEGQYCVGARDACWAAVASIEADVLAGNRPAPSGFEDIRAELPALSWPA